MALSERQRKFCEYYAANPCATAAAQEAGYSERTARAQGARLLTNVDIMRYVQQLQGDLTAGRIASMKEVKAYWSSVMNSAEEKTADRLRASELLAKSAGAFLHLPPGTDGGAAFAVGCDGSGEDVLIYVPQMLVEEECQAQEDEIP